MHETGAMLNPFSQSLLVGVQNIDPIVWLTGANLSIPVSHLPHTAWHTRPSKSYNFRTFIHILVNFHVSKMVTPYGILEARGTQVKLGLGHTGVWSH